MSNQALGERFRELREELGLQQKDLARLLGVVRSAISQIEHGKQGLAGSIYELLESRFGVRREWLETGRGERRYESWHIWADTFGDSLRRALERRGETPGDLAVALEESAVDIELVLSGKMLPSGDLLGKLARAFNTTVEALAGWQRRGERLRIEFDEQVPIRRRVLLSRIQQVLVTATDQEIEVLDGMISLLEKGKPSESVQ